MLTDTATTILGTIGAALAFLVGSGEVGGQIAIILGALNAAITFALGKTHPGQ